jgi:hypothetical protein
VIRDLGCFKPELESSSEIQHPIIVALVYALNSPPMPQRTSEVSAAAHPKYSLMLLNNQDLNLEKEKVYQGGQLARKGSWRML